MSRSTRRAARPNQMLDHLTGVYSRVSLDTRLEEEVARARRYTQPFSLLMVDLDHFKSINDGFSHARGDAALVEFAHRIKQETRRGDLVFRLGGDEFILLLPNTGHAEATLLAQRLVESVCAAPFAGDPPISLTVSIGVACFPVDGRLPDELMRTAEQHAYQAKRLGRNRVADSIPPATGEPSFDVLSRLIERDEAQERLLRFIDSLPRQSRSLLRVSGAPGCGQSRFLMEVEKMARLRGYAVLVLRGSPALQLRLFGALCEAQGLDGLPHPAGGISVYASALCQRIAQEGWSGVVIVIDDLMYLDRASQEFLHDLYFAGELPQLALAFADQAAGARLDFLHEIARPLCVDLQPFTPQGVRLWLRHTLQWEAPQDFVDWLHAETGGRPADLKRAASQMVRQNWLRRQADGWALSPAFSLDAHPPEWLDRPASPGNLPAPPGDFVGREHELRQIKRQLARRRIVSILGPGGLGKTRLSLQAALESQGDYRDGVFFLSLATLASSEYLPAALADTLRITLKPSTNLRAELLAHLKSKELLLVLDGFENLLDGAALLVDIFERALGVRLLVTSRQRLETSLGAVIQLTGLDFPESDALPQPESYPAVQLFLHNAHLAHYQGYPQPLDWSDRQQASAVMRICRLVRGIPLGLELAAAWCDAISLPEIAESIERGQEFLLAESGGQEGAQHSLKVIFETFWRSLSEYEQGILRQLAVFRGGFSLEAAQQVAGASPFFLYALAAQSYLRLSAKTLAFEPGRETEQRASLFSTSRFPQVRYETHLLLQQYALERLHSQPEQEAQTRLRHCRYYTAYLQQRGERLRRERLAQQEIRLELDNIRSAWRYACENCMLDCIERCLDALVDFYAFAGLLNEGQRSLQLAVECASQSHTASPVPASAALLARLRAHLAWLYQLTADNARAIELAAQAGALAQEYQLAAQHARAELVLGTVSLGQAQHASARQHLQHALELAQAAADRQLEADCLRILGNVEIDISDGVASLQYYQRSLQLCQTLGNRRGEGAALNNLGLVATYRDDYDTAGPYFQQFLEIAVQVGDTIGEGDALLNLALVDTMTYHFTSGRGYAERAVALLESIGARYDALYALWALAFLEMSQGDLLACQLRYAEVQRRSEEIGDSVAHARILLDIAQLDNRLGDFTHALALAGEGLQLGRDLSLSDVVGHGHNLTGFARLALGHPEQAEPAYQEAAGVWRQEGRPNLLAESLAGLALVALRRGEPGQALAHVAEILAYLEQGSLAGALEPANVYLACCQVLAAAQDPRLPQVLASGKAWLLEKADLQSSPALRRMFLEDLPLHRQLLEYEG